MLKRRKGDDRWVTSGGRKGASERWITTEMGILKRYGRVVRGKAPALKFAQYTMLHARVGRGGQRETADDKSTALWVVQPNPDAHSAANVLTAPQAGPGQAVLDIHAAPSRKFISFQGVAASGDGIELGAIVRHNGGVTLESKQGDFAEWHRRAADEDPFEEGDVVGFRRGRISRKTHNCGMLGVVSRKAVVEGSAPPEGERHLYDTVAYSGVVPVKLSRRKAELGCDCPTPQTGQLLAPSGRNDGTAILVPATESVSRVGILLDEYAALEDGKGDDSHRLVTMVVVAPTETVRGGLVPNTSTVRKLVLALIWCMVTVTCAVYLIHHLGLGLPPGSAGEPVCLALSSTHNLTKLAEAGYTFKDASEVSVSRLGLKCAEGYSGTAVLTCAGHQASFSEPSGCTENSCSAPLVYNLGDGDDGEMAVIKNAVRSESGQDLDVYTITLAPVSGTVNGVPFWRTPVVHVADLGLGCAAGFRGPDPTAKCLVDQGNFSDFTGCKTNDMCTLHTGADAPKHHNHNHTGTAYENTLECQRVSDAFTLDAPANSHRCLAHDICQYCTMTSLGAYCSWVSDEALDNDAQNSDGQMHPTNTTPGGAVPADEQCGAGEYLNSVEIGDGLPIRFCSGCESGQSQPFEYDPTESPRTQCYACFEGQFTAQGGSATCETCSVCKDGYVQSGACWLDQDTSCRQMTEEEQAAPAERFRVGDEVQVLFMLSQAGIEHWYPATVDEVFTNSSSGTTVYEYDIYLLAPAAALPGRDHFRRQPQDHLRRAPEWKGMKAAPIIDHLGFAQKDGPVV